MVRIWDLNTGKVVLVLNGVHKRKPIVQMSVSDDGTQLATGSEGGMICIWQLVTGAAPHCQIKGLKSSVSELRFSPSGNQIIIISALYWIREDLVGFIEQLKFTFVLLAPFYQPCQESPTLVIV